MTTLALSICCSVAVSVLLKIARSRGVHIGQAIAVNYVVASVLCLALLKPSIPALLTPSHQWWLLGALGVVLPTVFLIMAAAVRHAGIVLSDAAQRLSLVVPLLAAFLWFGEALSTTKLMGVILALAALAGLLLRPAGRFAVGLTTIACLLGVWAGYGAIDILFKTLARQGQAFSTTLLGAFALAGIIMFVGLAVRRSPWTIAGINGGVALGLLNFGNIYFYIRAHQTFPENPSLVFASMNIGVIVLGTLTGALLFGERLTTPNKLGIGLAVGAVWVLFRA
ncbi:DMT family transporter [Pusillimonas minor]|uniref:DMT family transporter n=1 Tax=Pusillimonas minor TaxID=2697024 RepID=A0A842HN62_9BURK|nr:DMT family transporter [Pusillimonas minor]MBC2769676.1 DMT family transporter [Pusillimonas minor]